MRVHELAKKWGVASKDLIAKIKVLGGEVKNHMSVVEEDIIKKLESSFQQKSEKISPAKEVKKEKPQEKKTASKTASREKASKAVAPEAPAPKEEKPTVPKVEKASRDEIKSEPATPQKSEEVKEVAAPPKPSFVIRFPITVGNLAQELKISVAEMIKALMQLGVFANINQLLNQEIVMHLADVLNIEIQKIAEDEKVYAKAEVEDPAKLKLRPPVATMMGHVDHGKTSLLDAIRKTNVAAREKGAITQHIGAYGVEIPGKGHVTFIDTPGHAAFTAMRARGANVTDVVVLVVAADDGVMPQTIEAVDHAREANCPIIVAINKADLPAANPQKVMTGLQKIGLMPEEWGGKTVCVKVSAKTGAGIDQLLEMLLLESEILDLKANPDRPAVGSVIEGHLSKGSGPVATVIVQNGTLKIGDIIICGTIMGRIRSMRNDRGKAVKEAGPSFAVEISGLSGVPEAGEPFLAVEDEKVARKITDQRLLEAREIQLKGASKHLSLEELYHRISEGNFKELKIIIKSDVQGSMEALAKSLQDLSTDQCQVRVIHAGTGGINESDVMLAAASDAIVLGFHVKADTQAQDVSEKEGVDLRFYNIIYEAVDDVRKAMEGLLEPTYKEVVEGKAEIRKIFQSSRVGAIAGGFVIKGKIIRTNRIRVIRNQVVLHEGKLGSLKRFKDDVRDVAQGYECGFVVTGFQDLKEGDIIESYRLDKIATKLA